MRIAGAVLTAALAGAAFAQTAGTSPVVFGDWRQDAPGVVHLITPGDLPSPFATSSAGRSPSVVAMPQPAPLRVPPGFTVSLIARGLDMPREMKTAPNGDVFLAESGAGRIRILTPEDPQHPVIFARDMELPYGMLFWPPGPNPSQFFVAEGNRVVRYRYKPGQRLAIDAPDVVIPQLPTGGHWTRDLAISPDGRTLYVAIGSSSNLGSGMRADPPGGSAAWQAAHGLGAAWGDDQGRADVLAYGPDGVFAKTFATGLRNCSGEAIQPQTGDLFCAVNERDGLGDNLPPDYVTRVATGAFYGWPWFYIGDHPDPRLHNPPAGLEAQVTIPDVLIQPHSAPLGIAFYDGTQFPAEYRGDAFVALHGSWNRAERTGYKVVRVRFRNGKPSGEYQDFLTGFVLSDRTVFGRPVGVAVAPDGSLLVSEDGNGTVWRVSYQQ
jgi:glucose/arabinose dehydrogenase